MNGAAIVSPPCKTSPQTKRVTRFDAEIVGDHCLNSTISALRKYGVDIERRQTTRPTRFGKDARCCEYWLTPDNYDVAERMLEAKRKGVSA